MQSLIFRDVVPFSLLFVLLIGGAILADWALHVLGLVWIGRYFGIVGTLLILASFVYSLRKHHYLRRGSPKTLLLWHEYLAWLGSLMILIHGGIHFNALLPWYALIAMMVAVASGLTGKWLLHQSRRAMEIERAELERSGVAAEQIEKQLFWDAIACELMTKWRSVHLPVTLLFALLAFFHILTIFIFWRWR